MGETRYGVAFAPVSCEKQAFHIMLRPVTNTFFVYFEPLSLWKCSQKSNIIYL